MGVYNKKDIRNTVFSVMEIQKEPTPTFGLFANKELLTTPKGIPVTAADQRGLRVMCSELDLSDVLSASGVSFYCMYSTMKDFVVPEKSCLGDSLFCSLAQDAVLQTCSGPESVFQWEYYSLVIRYLSANNLKHPCHSQFPTDNCKHGYWNEEAWSKNYMDIAVFVEKQLRSFTPSQSSGFLTAMTFLKSPIISLMLVLGEATPKEAAYLYLLSNCIYSKGFPDVKRREEKEVMDSITQHSECVRSFHELF